VEHALLLLQRAILDAGERGDTAAVAALERLAADPDRLAEFARTHLPQPDAAGS
jgi:hypothetical protein